MKLRPTKLAVIVLVFFLSGCSSSGTKESTTSQDTITSNATDSITNSTTEAKPIVVSEAKVTSLGGILIEQFEKVYKDVADTSTYIKVMLFDYYNEYEGQDEAWEAELYFDKAFSLRFFSQIHVTGVDGGDDIKEYIVDNNVIIAGRERYPYYENERDEKTIIHWHDSSGVIQSKTTYRGTTHEPLQDDYKIKQFKSVEKKLSSVINVLHKGELLSETEDSFSVIIIEEKENSDLIDSTRVIVPKIIYKHLKNMD